MFSPLKTEQCGKVYFWASADCGPCTDNCTKAPIFNNCIPCYLTKGKELLADLLAKNERADKLFVFNPNGGSYYVFDLNGEILLNCVAIVTTLLGTTNFELKVRKKSRRILLDAIVRNNGRTRGTSVSFCLSPRISRQGVSNEVLAQEWVGTIQCILSSL